MRKIILTLTVTVGAVLPLASASASATPAAKNIVQVAAGAPQFSTLVALVKQARLVSALEGSHPLTVFAPTNRAFAALKRMHPALFNEVAHSRSLLRSVLLYHVVAGRLTAAKVTMHHRLKTLLGQRLRVRVRGMSVRINQAKVVEANIAASNGVIHAINAVLLPKLG